MKNSNFQIIFEILKKIKFIIKYISNRKISLSINSIKYTDSNIQLEKIINGIKKPVVIDIGAHHGETTFKIKSINNKSLIYCFEPSKGNFNYLKKNTEFDENIKIFNFGLGEKNEEKFFFDNNASPISSFQVFDKANQLESHWGVSNIKNFKKYKVNIIKFDTWMEEQKINKVDFFKIDTQGFELNILKGARNSLEKKLIKSILIEIIFVRVYKNQPSFEEINKFLYEFNFKLNGIVDPSYNSKGDLLQADFLYELQ